MGNIPKELSQFYERLTSDEQREYWSFMKSQDVSTPDYQVNLFCRIVLRKVLPRDLIGSPKNWSRLLESVEAFVKLRSREEIRLDKIVEGMSTNDLKWTWPSSYQKASLSTLASKSLEDSQNRQELLLELMLWIFDNFLPTLIRSHFYATESAGSKRDNGLTYFRHDVWAKISGFAFDEFSDRSSLAILPHEEASNTEKYPLGASPIRIMPKTDVQVDRFTGIATRSVNGYRPIVCMGRKRRVQTEDGSIIIPSINSKMIDAFDAVSFEHRKKVENTLKHTVATISSVPELCRRILNFKQSIESEHTSLPELFFVKVDIKRCFDTIPQDLALRLSQRMLETGDHDEYKDYFFHTFLIRKMSPQSQSTKKGEAPHFRLYRRNVEYPGSETSSMDVARKWSKRYDHRLHQPTADIPGTFASKSATVVTDLVHGKILNGSKLAQDLDNHLTRNLVYLEGVRGHHIYKQQVGVPQGSKLSTLLCNVVYEELEKYLLKQVFGDDPEPIPFMLVRFTDDFLFVTTSQDRATSFLDTMIRGIPKYGAAVSPEKTIINFPSPALSQEMLLCRVLESDEVMPFIGVGINTKTLEMLRDSHAVDTTPGDELEQTPTPSLTYQRYIKNTTLEPSLPTWRPPMFAKAYGDAANTVHLPPLGARANPKNMCRALVLNVSIRLVHELVDLRLNSWRTVLENVHVVVKAAAKRIVYAVQTQWGFSHKHRDMDKDYRTIIQVLTRVLDKVVRAVHNVNRMSDQKDIEVLKSAAGVIASIFERALRAVKRRQDKMIFHVGLDYLESLVQ